jgi:hypothetical protein
MTVRPPCLARTLRRLAAPLALGAILLVTGCYYNGHRNMGATEKWVGSDINYVPKIIGTIPISIVDAIIGPFTMLWDQLAYDPQYNPRHRYFSYAASRTVARSDMGGGYIILASIPTIIIDTVYLIITVPIDIIWVLGWGDDEPEVSSANDWAVEAEHSNT